MCEAGPPLGKLSCREPWRWQHLDTCDWLLPSVAFSCPLQGAWVFGERDAKLVAQLLALMIPGNAVAVNG